MNVPPPPSSPSSGALGDRIGDAFQWSVGAVLVVGILWGLLRLLGLTWALAPWAVLGAALFCVVVLLLVRTAVRMAR